VENAYTAGMKFTFRDLRRQRESILNNSRDMKISFKDFLTRSDKKQPLVDAFQKEFNEIDEDYRFVVFLLLIIPSADADTKAELHQRADDLRDRLWDMCDKRREESEAERVSAIENRWAEDQYISLCNAYVTMMQLEVDRYVTTKQVALDFTRDANELVMTFAFHGAK
jgi:hypothetical protein